MNKRGQTSDTIMWIVATIVIIILLIISIVIAGSMGKINSIDSVSTQKWRDVLVAKSFFSFLLTKESGNIFFEKIRADNKISTENKDAFDKIFSIYKNDYNYFWLEIADSFEKAQQAGSPKFPFGTNSCRGIYRNIIKLNNKYLVMYYLPNGC